ncbi:hypothetical protein MZM54_01565 [[Brevibacterium] frigoritolerans]|nr:hypothetical protein [Peribacillus frigoritolerans]
MGKFDDITGKTFGNLVVEGIGERKNSIIFWSCLCSCGNRTSVRGYDLKGEKVKSCGCLRRRKGRSPSNKVSDRKLAMIKAQYSRFKEQAKRRSYPTTITLEEFSDLIMEPCHYCGGLGSKEKEDFDEKRRVYISDFVLKFNGIDRIDSEQGYTKENCVTCCKTCNVAKSDLPLDTFVSWLGKVYDFNFNK